MEEKVTFRQILHRFTRQAPWTELGIDMVLGAEVDRPLTPEQQQFIPSIYEEALAQAHIRQADGTEREAVVLTHSYAPTAPMEREADFPLSPVAAGWLLFALVLVASIFDVRRGFPTLWVDIVLFSLQGLAGCVIAFLFFFSEHPAVGSNWLVVTFNPLIFVLLAEEVCRRRNALALLPVSKWSPTLSVLGIANMAGLLFALVMYFAGWQWLHPALLPVVLSLLLRSLVRGTLYSGMDLLSLLISLPFSSFINRSE